MISHLELLARIILGAVLGGIIGYERDRHGRHVGLRTHLIVSMASATYMVTSAHFMFYQNYDAQHYLSVDPSRIASSVVTGIGFLAAGAIIRTAGSIQGLTTAAGLWLVTAIGLAAGAGMYVESCAVTLLGIIALTFLRRFEDKDDKIIRRNIALTFHNEPHVVTAAQTALTQANVTTRNVDYEKRFEDSQVIMSFEVLIPGEFGLNNFMQLLEGLHGLKHIKIQTPK